MEVYEKNVSDIENDIQVSMKLFDFLMYILHKYRQLFYWKIIVHIPEKSYKGLILKVASTILFLM